MMRKFLLPAMVTALVAVTSFSQQNRKDEDLLRALITRLVTAQVSYDSAALDKIFTADYIEISPVGEFDPRAKVLRFYTPEEQAKMTGTNVSVQPNEYSIRVYKDIAIVIVRLDYSMTNNGAALPPRSIRATFVCKKEERGWKIASAQYTGMKPAPPAKP
jgi:uncharacterized protein (TIGR02246 family)